MKVVWALALSLLVSSSPAQRPFAVTAPAAPVVFGQPFELTVTVTGRFDDARLAPLVVERLDERTIGARTELRYRARCYQLGDVVLVSEPPVTLQVATCLPEPPGELEWPSDGWSLQPAAGRDALWIGVGVAALLLAVGWWRFTRSRAAVAVDVVAPSTYDAAAALRELSLPGADDDVLAFYADVKAIVRRHCSRRHRVPAEVRTSEELVAQVASGRDLLAPCLQACDLVLFARQHPAGRRHADTREQAIAFVERAEVSS